MSRLLQSTVFQLTLAVVAGLGLLAAVAVVWIGHEANLSLSRVVEGMVEADAARLRSVVGERGLDGLAASVREQSRLPGPSLYIMTDATGIYQAGNIRDVPISVAASEGRTPARRGLFRVRMPGGSETRLAAGVLIDLVPGGVLFIGQDVEEQRRLVADLNWRLAVGLGLLALTGIAAGLLLSRYILGRIAAMSTATASIVEGHLTERLPRTGSGDELDRLADQLNQMLDRIGRLVLGMREVSDNIAHDLRTPLNRLRNRAEEALNSHHDPASWKLGLERTIEDADELIKTFNALLLIARLEAGAVRQSFEPVDLTALVRDVAELYEPAADEAGFRIACQASDHVLILANKQLIGQAVANLIDNAIKYSRGADASGISPIEVALGADDGSAHLSVADRGPGIAPADRDRALRRFGRLDDSRTTPGTGLGLNLVAAVAQMHRGSLSLEDHGPGLRVVLSLPLAPATSPKPQLAMSKEGASAL